MAPAHDFSKMVPGFDFLQGLVKNASSALPSLGQWVAPTLDPEELAKRIEELKTVQFWLEQNARMIGTTVQALEVQRMTLTTLKTMNVQVADLAQAFKLQDPVPASAASFVTPPAAAPAAAPSPAPAPADTAASRARAKRSAGSAGRAAPSSPAGAAPGVVDPLQWWGALTQQFTQLAAQALKDRPADGASGASGATSAAGPATATSAAAGKDAAGASRKGPGGAARKATPGSRSAHAGRGTTSSTAPKSAPRQASRKA